MKKKVNKNIKVLDSGLNEKIVSYCRQFFGSVRINFDSDLHDYHRSGKTIDGLYAYLNEKLRIAIEPARRRIHRPADVAADMENYLIKRSENATKIAVIPRAGIRDYYPLSSAQKRIWVLYRLEPLSPFYNISDVREISGPLNAAVLEKVLRFLISRHASLRSNFREEEKGEPAQTIAEPSILEQKTVVEYHDLTGLGRAARTKKRLKLIRKTAETPFRLETGPLFRACLIKTAGKKHIFIVVMHHIIADDWSLGVFWRELSAAYQAYLDDKKPELPPLPLRYVDYAVWEQSEGNTKQLEKQERYWLKAMKKPLPVLDLPADKPQPPVQSHRGSIASVTLDATVTAGLKAIARRADTTFFTLLLAIGNIWLHKLSGQDDIITGILRANRDVYGLENMIGIIHNNLPIRSRIKSGATFAAYLQNMKDNVLSSLDNGQYPFERLVEKLNPERDMSRNPIFTVLFQFFNESDMADAPINFRGITASPSARETHTAQLNLAVHFIELSDKLVINANYTTDLFERATIERYLGYLKTLVGQISEDPEKKVSALCLMVPDEQRKLLRRCAGPAASCRQKETIHRLFEEQAGKTPDDVAVKSGDKTLTYAELDRKAGRMASYLRDKHKVKPEDVVAVMLDRTPEMIITVLAVLKAGGAYLPIDPEYPAERIEYMLEDAKVKVVLTSKDLKDKKFAARSTQHDAYANNRSSKFARSKVVDIFDPKIREYPATNPDDRANPDNLAYVIYTSGSTGNPKGVQLTHRGIINHVFAKIRLLKLGPGDIIAYNLSPGFVASIWQVAAPLVAGACVAVYTREEAYDPGELLKRIHRDRTTILSLAPSQLPAYISVAMPDAGRLGRSALRTIILTGESVPGSLIKKYHEKYAIPLINAYGQAECSDDTLHYRIPENSDAINVPVGKPSGNIWAYVLDKDMNLLPSGIPGELYISGAQLARGYLGDKKMTRAAFLKNPFYEQDSRFSHRLSPEAGDKMYKTGDRAKMLLDGNIEILGRLDGQIKIRGQRLEPGEIEARISDYPGVKIVAVKAFTDQWGDGYLAAYYTAVEKGIVDTNRIKDFLKLRLPDYMIPKYFTRLPQMPLSVSGKIDRHSLPAPREDALARKKYILPQSGVEEKLAAIWREILNVKQVSREDDFFDLGGHSLKAISLLVRINKEFTVDLPLRDIFTNHILKDLADAIARRRGTAPVMIPRAPERKNYALSHAQKRIFILCKLEPDSTFYNMIETLELVGFLDINALQKALDLLVERHESFRTNFIEVNGMPVQKIHAQRKVKIDMAYKESEKAVNARVNAPFRLETGPLFRACLIKTAGKKHIFIVVMHHIIADDWSLGVFWRELSAAYQAYLDDKKPELPPLPLRYVDYAVWEQSEGNTKQLEKQERYWLKAMKKPLPVLDLPADKPQPPVQSHRGSIASVTLDATVTAGLKAIARRADTTFFTLLLAIGNIWLHKLSGQDDIITGILRANRDVYGLENMIGIIHNNLPIRSRIKSGATFAAYLQNMKDNVLSSLDNGQYPFERLVEKLNPERDMSRNPIFTVLFQFFNESDMADAPINFRGITASPSARETHTAQLNLAVHFIELSDKLVINANYTTDLFERATIERYLGYLKTLVGQISEDPEKKVSALCLMVPDEQRKLLRRCAGPAASCRQKETIHRLFEEQAGKTPDDVAVKSGDKTLTYAELDRKAGRMASYLRDKHKVKPEDVVAVMLDRTPEMIITVLAVLKAGGAYLPIDPEYPAERIEYMLEDAKVKVVLTSKDLKDKKFAARSTQHDAYANNRSSKFARSKVVDIFDPKIREYPATNPDDRANPDNLAYVIYTSGSTGSPKGVMIEHRSAVNLICGIIKKIGFEPKQKILFSTTVAFDISFLEMILPLTLGMQVVVADEDTRKNPACLVKLIKNNKIDILQMTPAGMRIILDGTGNKALPNSIKRLLIGGEKFEFGLLREIQQVSKAVIYNMYGPTETTVWSHINDVTGFLRIRSDGTDKFESLPIGKPIANTQSYVLDENRELLPPGIPGELCISGVQLARGYIGDRKRTRKAFIRNPFAQRDPRFHGNRPDRLYKTGDRAKINPDGELVILGRLDDQIKIRGFRVEPGEIEATVKKCDQRIRETIVRPISGDNGNDRLAAFYTAGEKKSINTEKLKQYLRSFLPAYMIPDYFIRLKQLPVTVSGKIDRKKLPEPEEEYLLKNRYEAPKTNSERKLAEIWQKVLGVNKISRYDNFFSLGGHSLAAIRLMYRLENEFNFQIEMKELFMKPQLYELAEYLEKNITTKKAPGKRPSGPGKRYPLTMQQIVFWRMSAGVKPRSISHIYDTYIADGEVDIDKMKGSLQFLIDKHESLRANFFRHDDRLWQMIRRRAKPDIEYIELAKTSNRPEEALRIISSAVEQPFDLENDVLFRTRIIRVGANRHIFAFVFHHIIFDYTSLNLFVAELAAAYGNTRASNSDYPAGDGYGDFLKAAEVRSYEAQEKYWQKIFSDFYPAVTLPGKAARIIKSDINRQRNVINRNLSIGTAGKSDAICRQNGITHFMFFLAAFNLLLFDLSGQTDLAVGSPVNLRTKDSLKNVIGLLINNIAFRSRINPGITFLDYLKTIKNDCIGAFSNYHVPISHIIRNNLIPAPKQVFPNVYIRVLYMEPSVEVKFSDRLAVRTYTAFFQTMPFDLELITVISKNGEYTLKMRYNPGFFGRKTIYGYMDRFIRLLDRIVADPSRPLKDLIR